MAILKVITGLTFIYPSTARVIEVPQMASQQFFTVLHCPLELGELQARPFLDVIFPILFLFSLSASPFHCALLDSFGQTGRTGDMSIPLQSASLYDSQEVFVWSDCLLDLGTYFLVGNMVVV